MRVSVESRVVPTARLQQVASLFDLEVPPWSRVAWDVDLPLGERPWNIGLIGGPSGSGKSTVARKAFETQLAGLEALPPWPVKESILDGFPEEMAVREITGLLSAVGFSSPPAWLRPFGVLSTGQQFRANLARLLAVTPALPDGTAVMDEFTSVVDRTVAKVGSAAVAKAVRARNLKFVAVTCHDDVIEWLQPDWTLRADTMTFAWRSLRQRPPVAVELVRTTAAAWPLFAPHHYLSHALAAGALCWLASVKLPGEEHYQPAAFSSWINRLTLTGGRREHRTVVLPDYQGIGLGTHVSDTIASMWRGLGEKAYSTTTHPAFISARKRSTNWRMSRPPKLAAGHSAKAYHATTRLTAGFEYVGPALDHVSAIRLLSA